MTSPVETTTSSISISTSTSTSTSRLSLQSVPSSSSSSSSVRVEEKEHNSIVIAQDDSDVRTVHHQRDDCQLPCCTSSAVSSLAFSPSSSPSAIKRRRDESVVATSTSTTTDTSTDTSTSSSLFVSRDTMTDQNNQLYRHLHHHRQQQEQQEEQHNVHNADDDDSSMGEEEINRNDNDRSDRAKRRKTTIHCDDTRLDATIDNNFVWPYNTDTTGENATITTTATTITDDDTTPKSSVTSKVMMIMTNPMLTRTDTTTSSSARTTTRPAIITPYSSTIFSTTDSTTNWGSNGGSNDSNDSAGGGSMSGDESNIDDDDNDDDGGNNDQYGIVGLPVEGSSSEEDERDGIIKNDKEQIQLSQQPFCVMTSLPDVGGGHETVVHPAHQCNNLNYFCPDSDADTAAAGTTKSTVSTTTMIRSTETQSNATTTTTTTTILSSSSPSLWRLIRHMLVLQIVVWLTVTGWVQVTSKLTLEPPVHRQQLSSAYEGNNNNAMTLITTTDIDPDRHNNNNINNNTNNVNDGMEEDDCIYVPGGGFSGFWFSLGRLQSLKSQQQRDEQRDDDPDSVTTTPNETNRLESHQQQQQQQHSHQRNNNKNNITIKKGNRFVCYSAGCLGVVASLLDRHSMTDLYAIARSIQLDWVEGRIHRYQVVEAFVDAILLGMDSHNQQFDDSDDGNNNNIWNILHDQIHIVTTVPTDTGMWKAQIQQPYDAISLKRMLLQTTWIPLAVGPSFTHHGHMDGAFSILQHPTCRRHVGLVRLFDGIGGGGGGRNGGSAAAAAAGRNSRRGSLSDLWSLWSNTLNMNLQKEDVEDLWQMGLEYGA